MRTILLPSGNLLVPVELDEPADGSGLRELDRSTRNTADNRRSPSRGRGLPGSPRCMIPPDDPEATTPASDTTLTVVAKTLCGTRHTMQA
jgi:hypothetical protein